MKMENDLSCDKSGVVKRLLIGEGDVMATDQPLIEFVGEGAAAPAAAEKEVVADGPVMLAPMGGTVMEFKVKPGDSVKTGDTILVYEAMKMENNLVSDRDGVIGKFLIEEGDVMATDQPIVQFGGAKAAAKAAPKPAPKPAAKPAAKPAKADDVKVEVPSVHPVDINRALPSVDGGTSGVNPVLERRKAEGAELRLASGTTMEINVSPDGGISIRISTGK